jgi:penicillin-binding protein 1A
MTTVMAGVDRRRIRIWPADASEQDYDRVLSSYSRCISGMQPGLVTASDAKEATVYLASHQSISLELAAMSWARPHINDDRVGAAPTSVSKRTQARRYHPPVTRRQGRMAARSDPAAQAALTSINPEDGSIQALVGGFNFR